MTAFATAARDDVLRLAGVVPESIVDGPGLRLTIFTQGCPHHCPGCHNPETHDPACGTEQTLASIMEDYQANPLLSGITFSGGEPFLQPAPLVKLGKMVHALGGNVITYTGYTLEKLLELAPEASEMAALLAETDILVDGPFERKLASLEVPFRGSANQRLIPRQEYIHLLQACV